VNVDVTINGDDLTAIIQVTGDLAYGSTDVFVRTIADLTARARGLRHLRVDMAALSFFDSAGLASLLTAHSQAVAAGMELHLDNRPAQLNRVLDITGMQKLFAAG
jgi:anti-anti-sigma factor